MISYEEARWQGLRTTKQWQKQFRKIKPDAEPVAVAVESDGAILNGQFFRPEDTLPFKPTPQRYATTRFCRYFTDFADKSRWISDYTDQNGVNRTTTEQASMRTALNRGTGKKYEYFQSLESLIKKHIHGDKVLGTYAGKRYTHECRFDLDLHEKDDPEIFKQRFRILGEFFHGRYRCHFETHREKTRGVKIILVFDKPWPIDKLQGAVTNLLERLDNEHPGLNFSGIEVFPANKKQIRLPLRKDYQVLTDGPLPMVYNKRIKKNVPDLVGYIRWLENPDRSYVPFEDVFRFVVERIQERPQQQPTAKATARRSHRKTKTKRSGAGLGAVGKMKGRFIPSWMAFWRNEHNIPDTLSVYIGWFAQIAFYQELPMAEGIARCLEWCVDLTDTSFSDRLSGDWQRLEGDVWRTFKGIYTSKHHYQPDPEQSEQKWRAVLAYCEKAGLDLLDKSTWDSCQRCFKTVEPLDIAWTEEQEKALLDVADILVTDWKTAKKAVEMLLGYIAVNHEVALVQIPAILRDLNVRWYHEKAARFRKMLEELGWIIKTANYWHNPDGKGRGNAYQVGIILIQRREEEKVSIICVGKVENSEPSELPLTSPDRHRPSPSIDFGLLRLEKERLIRDERWLWRRGREMAGRYCAVG